MLTLYNTLLNKKELFSPLDSSHVKMYVCGPTVYDFAHVGNARPVVVFDILYRLLQKLYPKVTYVRNVTDVDDKILQASHQKNKTPSELTKETLDQFHKDMKEINALSPTIEPKATEHIQDMIDMIQNLIRKGYAYEAEGHVLFHVASFVNYGKLSNRHYKDMVAGARVEIAPYKKDPADFVLWKPSKDLYWDSPWGKGRPGWHIECSAMSARYLGEVFDIHGGGIDLTFPHHENEMAQSCSAFEKEVMARFWVHNGHVTVNKEKMSKSLGNIVTVYDALKNYSGVVVRLALLSSHYRQPLNWTESLLKQCQSNLERFHNVLCESEVADIIDLPPEILDLLCDDLNLPGIFVLMHEYACSYFKTHEILFAKKLLSCLSFLDLLPSKKCIISQEEIDYWIEERQKAKKEKNYLEADRIRNMLKEKNVIIEDTAQGVRVK